MRWGISARLILVALVFGGVAVGYKGWQEHERNVKVQREIDALAEEANKIRRENETLAQKIAYLASPDFQEQEAKQKLGLRRQEETVVALREVPKLDQPLPSEPATPQSAPRFDGMTPNYIKWWRIFFQ